MIRKQESNCVHAEIRRKYDQILSKTTQNRSQMIGNGIGRRKCRIRMIDNGNEIACKLIAVLSLEIRLRSRRAEIRRKYDRVLAKTVRNQSAKTDLAVATVLIRRLRFR